MPLSKEEELTFQIWYSKWAKKLKLNPDPDDPRHFYDYRKAWEEGASPSWQPEHQQYRWPDEYKKEGYPYE